MRNYWALLPAIAVCVVLALVYAVPTLINPQLTAAAVALFRRDTEPVPLDPAQRRGRRYGAIGVLVAALALVGFNVSLNREANGCYIAARAWGADGAVRPDDPCTEMIYGNTDVDLKIDPTDDSVQPVPAFQVVTGDRPKYLRWVESKPRYEQVDLLIGLSVHCASNVKYAETDDKVTIVLDADAPCPPDDNIHLVWIKLDKPLGDRAVVTVDDKPISRIDPEMQSWPTVLKKLATGG